MSDDSGDFLTTRLGDVLSVEDSEASSQEEAQPWKCWGRGGKRPPLAQLNLKRFIEISKRKDYDAPEKLVVGTGEQMQPTVENEDNIMKGISSKCHEILGTPTTDKHISDWLQQNFSKAVERQTNKSLEESLYPGYSLLNNDDIQLRNNAVEQTLVNNTSIRAENNNDILCIPNQANNTDKRSEGTSYLPMQRTTDHEFIISSCSTPTSNFSSFKVIQSNAVSPDATSYDGRSIRCIPNKSRTFTIKNLPREVTRSQLINVLESFGEVESVVIIEGDEDTSANVRMGVDCDCSWIIECLNGTQPFGASLHLLS